MPDEARPAGMHVGLNPLYDQITLGVIILLAVGSDARWRLRT